MITEASARLRALIRDGSVDMDRTRLQWEITVSEIYRLERLAEAAAGATPAAGAGAPALATPA